MLNYSPGVNSGLGFRRSAGSGNALMLDGVDTSDPEGGTAWTFFNYNIIDEVQVGALGQPAEYGGFTGAVVNTITKSGGNRYSSLFEYRYTGKDLRGDNISDEVKPREPELCRVGRRQAQRLHRAARRSDPPRQGVFLRQHSALLD